MTSIRARAFYDCSSLKSVTIGSGVKNIYDLAFASCKELKDVYCLAEKVPAMTDYSGNGVTNAFQNSYIEYATLHVPTASIGAYRAKEPWKSFKSIVGLDGTPKCATPTIAFVDGELTFSCETEDVEYTYEVSYPATQKGSGSKIAVATTCRVTVYATRQGYDNSDTATLEFTLGTGGEVCDVNGDGAVNVADIATIIDEMAARARLKIED